MSDPEAILFDLDDTLIDRDLQTKAFAEVFQESFADALGPMERADLVRTIAEADLSGYRSRPEFASRLAEALPWRNAPSPEDLLAFWWQEFPRRSVPTAGLDEVLRTLRTQSYRLGIITNGSVRSQSAKIEHLGLRGHVDHVVISEGVGLHKPDPRIFHHALSQLDVPPERAWFVGDHPVNDVQGAAVAGLTPVWFQRNQLWPTDQPLPRRIIRALPHLLELVAE